MTFDPEVSRFRASRIYDTEPDSSAPSGCITRGCSERAARRHAAAPPPRWYTHRLNRPAFYRAGAALTSALPRPVRLALARGLARRAAAWFPAERARVRANLARVRRTRRAERERLVDEVFRHFAVCFADLVSTNRREARPDRLVARIEGDENLLRADAEGRGLVLVTAHLGNSELGGRLLAARLGRPTPRRRRRRSRSGRGALPARRRLARALRAARRSHGGAAAGGGAAAPRGGGAAGRPCARHEGRRTRGLLRRAGAISRSGPSCSPAPPARRSCRPSASSSVTSLHGAMARPIHVTAGGEASALAEWVGVLEAMVRRAPEQWFNFFDVWSARPAS